MSKIVKIEEADKIVVSLNVTTKKSYENFYKIKKYVFRNNSLTDNKFILEFGINNIDKVINDIGNIYYYGNKNFIIDINSIIIPIIKTNNITLTNDTILNIFMKIFDNIDFYFNDIQNDNNSNNLIKILITQNTKIYIQCVFINSSKNSNNNDPNTLILSDIKNIEEIYRFYREVEYNKNLNIPIDYKYLFDENKYINFGSDYENYLKDQLK